MRVRVRLFGFLAEVAGRREVTVELATATAASALEAVSRECPSLALRGVKVAVNDEFAGGKTPVRPGDVVSLLPPVGGG